MSVYNYCEIIERKVKRGAMAKTDGEDAKKTFKRYYKKSSSHIPGGGNNGRAMNTAGTKNYDGRN